MTKGKLTVILVAINFLAFLSSAQVTIWSEDFGTGCNQGQLASSYSGTNGLWTINDTGLNETEANTWFVSATEAGLPSGSCGDGCISNGTLINRSLHLGNIAIPSLGLTADNGASYNAGGVCGLFFCVATDRRVESPTINLSGQSNLTLNFNYMENGQTALDDASLWYFDGTDWSLLNTLAKTPATCAPQGQWTAFSVALPETADNNPNVKIGFRWVNNDDGIGTDPSFAVDDIIITAPSSISGPTAIITASNGIVCQGQSLIFNSTSTGSNITTYAWSFEGGTPSMANTAGPHSVVFNNVGNFNVQLTVTDEFNVTDDTLLTIQVMNCSTPTAAFSISDNDPCEGDCITFINNSSSISTPTYAWSFPGGTPSSSNLENPGPICYNSPGNYSVSLVVTNSFGTGSYVQNINVLPPPLIDVSGNTFINLGETATIVANSTDGEISWSWTPNNQGDILECTVSDCSQALVSPTINTTFEATVTSEEGCTASDIAVIGVNVPVTGYAIGVPNSFSPNGDNKNDMLMVDGLGISSLIFRIYNRYGQLVFESLDQSLGWDGKVNGEPLNPATFAWTLECIMVTGVKVELNGNVTLIK